MKNNWGKFYHRILKRQTPHAILSWRYFLPGQNRMVKLHKKTFLSAWSNFPRIVWCLIALYSYTLWYLFYGWRQVIRVWNHRSTELYALAHIPHGKQLLDLLALAFLHSTPPYFYYQYRLYRYREREWLNFIYTHELPHWHQMMSPNISDRSHHLMSHKQDFATEMMRLGLPAISSIYILLKGESIPSDQLFSRQSWFLKPETGSRKEGCYALIYQTETTQYRLEGDGIEAPLTKEQIRAIIDKKTQNQAYLIQPLLENYPLLAARCQCIELITIRLVTVLIESQPKAVSAVLEVPVEGRVNRVDIVTIDIRTGVLLPMTDNCMTCKLNAQQRLKSLRGFTLPMWTEVVHISEQAHQSFPDITSIGWDLAITPQGVKILEGNLNWSVQPHYLIRYTSMLMPPKIS